MGIGTGPCCGCSERHVGCHGKCEKYVIWNEQHKIEKEREISNRAREKFYARYIRERNIHLKEV